MAPKPATGKPAPELNSSSSSSLSASQWTTVLERTSPLENTFFTEDKPNSEMLVDQPKEETTPKRMVKPTLSNQRLISAEEVLSNDGPDDWSKLSEFMRTRVIGRPDRSRSEPVGLGSAGSQKTTKKSQKRKRGPTPDLEVQPRKRCPTPELK